MTKIYSTLDYAGTLFDDNKFRNVTGFFVEETDGKPIESFVRAFNLVPHDKPTLQLDVIKGFNPSTGNDVLLLGFSSADKNIEYEWTADDGEALTEFLENCQHMTLHEFLKNELSGVKHGYIQIYF